MNTRHSALHGSMLCLPFASDSAANMIHMWVQQTVIPRILVIEHLLGYDFT